MGKGKIVYHAMKRKIVAYKDSTRSKIFLVFLEKVDVLSLGGIYKNHIKKLGLVLPVPQLQLKGIAVNCINASVQSAIVNILLCLYVTVYIQFDCSNCDVRRHLGKLNCRKTDCSANFQDFFYLAFLDVIADKFYTPVPHNGNRVFSRIKFDVVQTLHSFYFNKRKKNILFLYIFILEFPVQNYYFLNMDTSDFEQIKDKLNTTGLFGSDASLGNLFILKERYKIECRVQDQLLLRYFDFSDSIRGYAFPLIIKNDEAPDQNPDYLQSFFRQITGGQTKKEISLCLFSEQQKNTFDDFLKKSGLPYSIEWKTNPADSDYIYLTQKLCDLSGNKLQKKKNHISQFKRRFKNYSFVYFTKDNFTQKLYDDFLFVIENWIAQEKSGASDALISDYYSEKESVKMALSNLKVFDFCGGILYIEDQPAAITLASKISQEVLDIHFEKCLSAAAAKGGYAVINNLFAKECQNFTYINREEDLGIEGLRKAKLSYAPKIVLQKYYGSLIKN